MLNQFKSTYFRAKGFAQRGFTLVEIAIATAILGAGLATLVSIQARVLDQYLLEQERMQAALAAQYIMTFYELQTDELPLTESTDSLIRELERFGFFNELDESGLREYFEGWEVERIVEPFAPEVNDPVLQTILEETTRKITLTVLWDENKSYELVLIAKVGKQL